MLKAQVNRLETAALRPIFEGHEVFVLKSDKVPVEGVRIQQD